MILRATAQPIRLILSNSSLLLYVIWTLRLPHDVYLPIGFLDFTTIQAALHHLVGKLSYTLAFRLLHIRVTLALLIICTGHTDAFTVFILTPEALPYPVYEPHHMSISPPSARREHLLQSLRALCPSYSEIYESRIR